MFAIHNTRMPADTEILREQQAYYRARASEYDDWIYRRRRYYRGEPHRQQWYRELGEVHRALTLSNPGGQVLELACGTGYWTKQLATLATSVTALDGAPEMLRRARTRLGTLAHVRYSEADLFEWYPERRYDFVFFGFWLSHIPRSRARRFWETIGAALEPTGKAFFVDSRLTPRSTAIDHRPPSTAGIVLRQVEDGRSFRVVKLFYEPARLLASLRRLGFDGYVRETREFFLYGCIHRAR